MQKIVKMLKSYFYTKNLHQYVHLESTPQTYFYKKRKNT